jgi:hypothetical protein
LGGHNNWSRRNGFLIKFLKAQVDAYMKKKELAQKFKYFPQGKEAQDEKWETE